MANARRTSLGNSLSYRGREGMWTWILHRATGLGVLLFLIIHVVETATVIYFPDIYDNFLASYKTGLFRFAELVIFFSVLFHAVNGTRIIVQDFWPFVMHRQRQLVWASAVVVVLAMLPVTWMMVAPLFGWAEEPGVARHQQRCAEFPEAPACVQDAGTSIAAGEVSL